MLQSVELCKNCPHHRQRDRRPEIAQIGSFICCEAIVSV
jgi:hypothetical protein